MACPGPISGGGTLSSAHRPLVHFQLPTSGTLCVPAEGHARIWIPDETIIDAIRGNALCFANAHRIQVNLTNEDVAFGIASYRRARGQRRPKYLVSAPLPLVSVLGAQRDKAA